MSAHSLGAYGQQMSTQLKNDSALGLGAVLVGSLPAKLMTDEAPDRYTVEAVFTRQADRDEVAAVHDGATRDYLSTKGYPTVELHVSDRRLEIHNTNLEELRDGLAQVIAEHLSEMSATIRAEREVASARFNEASHREQTRAAAVAALAESVTFSSSTPHADEDTAARADEWISEGGAARS
ncbi:outer membrane murein-binding lipoprotein Lpp [Microbacterium ginsengiterrae]|uniref:Outer membrane murein-binding lipoprotein Lpp n=1 Tax=Microbacterium ginsengiterrae TaxID=546115 RepID=A0A7W9C9V3_9MICO|nr:outer membrane murein-binding lipoprotein Lpp [Microbacterium ginsengiterrae]